jgi:hypothetical protein
METYKAKHLVHGAKVDRKLSGKMLVAVPDKYLLSGRPLFVANSVRTMVIRPGQEPLTKIEFPNKFGPGTYTLAYYEWKPEQLVFGESYGEKKEEIQEKEAV